MVKFSLQDSLNTVLARVHALRVALLAISGRKTLKSGLRRPIFQTWETHCSPRVSNDGSPSRGWQSRWLSIISLLFHCIRNAYY